MGPASVLDTLGSLAISETARLKASFRATPELNIDTRMAIIELSRAVDHFFMRPLLTKTPNDPLLDSLYGRGTSRALAAFLNDSVGKGGVPLVASVPSLQNWADSCVQHSGRLSQLDYLLELARDGVFRITQVGESTYRLHFDASTVDAEAFDVADHDWVQSFVARLDAPLHDILASRRPQIIKRMRDLVYPWRGSFIGYKTDPEIDDHYQAAGLVFARGLSGQTELPGEAKIDGLPFYAYRAAVAAMCACALKHLGFAAELALMRPDLERRNLWCIWHTREQWADYFHKCLDVPAETATRLVQSLALDREYVQSYRCLNGAPLPPFIQVSNNDLVMSLSGCLNSPFWYVLRKLREEHRSDWDRIIGGREEQFRRDLYQLFALPHIELIGRPVRIREDGRDVTDIDAVAYDRLHGTLVLFQLKWQDPFGYSMRERRSRMRNFVPLANRWISVVADWASRMAPSTLGRNLGLRTDLGKSPIRRVEIVVLARHHARFTGGALPDTRAAWGTWPQLCRIVSELYGGGNLKDVCEILRHEMNRSDSPRDLPSGNLRIGEVVIEIRSDPGSAK